MNKEKRNLIVYLFIITFLSFLTAFRQKKQNWCLVVFSGFSIVNDYCLV